MRSWRFSAVWCYRSLKSSAFTQISMPMVPTWVGEQNLVLWTIQTQQDQQRRSSQNCGTANVIFQAKCNQSCSINYMLNFSICQSRFIFPNIQLDYKIKGNNHRKRRLFVTQSTHDVVRSGVLVFIDAYSAFCSGTISGRCTFWQIVQ